MRIHACDICKKEKQPKELLSIYKFLNTVELCEKCAEPIVKFLKKHKLMEEEKE